MPITDLTFKGILKELVSLAIGNRKTFCPKPQSMLKNLSHPSTSGASLTVTPAMTAMTHTSSPQTSQLVLSMISLRDTSLPVNPGRGLLQTRCQAVVSQVPGLGLIDLSLARQ